MPRRLPIPSRAMVVALVALFLNLAGIAYAATGGTLVLGTSNDADAKTSLTAKTGGPALQLTNMKSRPGATALALNVAAAQPPLTTTSSTLVPNLNADLVDGLD